MGGGGQDWQKCLYLKHFFFSEFACGFPSSPQSIFWAAGQGGTSVGYT